MSSGATEIKHGSLLEVTSPETGSPEHDDLHISPVEIYKHRKLDWRKCCCPYEES